MNLDTCKGIIYGMILSALLSIPGSYLGAAQPADVNLVSINGQSVNGNNAVLKLKQLNIQNSNGSALVAYGRGTEPNFGHGIDARAMGNDGNGVYFEGRGNGDGFGGTAFNGSGAFFRGQGGHNGLVAMGDGAAAGLVALGGSNGGRGVEIYGVGQNAQGMLIAPGPGEAEGVQIVGRGHQAAFRMDGGELGGQGMLAQSQSQNANGAEFRGAGTGYGIYDNPPQPCPE